MPAGLPQAAQTSTRVLLVEDQELMRDLLVFGLKRLGFEVCAPAALLTEEVVAVARTARPDVALLDLRLGPGMTSVEMISPLVGLGLCVLMLTAASAHQALLARCIEEGASGIFDKAQPLSELLDVVNDAALGRTVMEPAARENLLGALQNDRENRRRVQPLLASLSRREREILGDMMRGLTADAISSSQYIAMTTVRAHIRSILRKLGVNSQLAAVVLAQGCGWAPHGPSLGPVARRTG
jgi:DNA-binding NarL/FixJ family response regulator